MKTLIVNSGGTSIKLDVPEVEDDTLRPTLTARHQTHGHDADALLKQFLYAVEHIDAVVHRVVHGGSKLVKSRVIDEQTEQIIEALGELAQTTGAVAAKRGSAQTTAVWMCVYYRPTRPRCWPVKLSGF